MKFLKALGFSVGGLAASTVLASVAMADDFHGFDPAKHDGSMIAADKLAAMVKDAATAHKPRNGKQLVIGFANLQRDITFCAKVEEGLLANAKAAGIDLQVADNRLDGATALANAESFLQRGVDYVIEFQTDANFGATIMQKMKEATRRSRPSTSRCPAPPSSAPTIRARASWAAAISRRPPSPSGAPTR